MPMNEFIEYFTKDIYLNFFGFGSILACIFTLLTGTFMITLRNRSKSTTRLGLVFFTMSFFNLGYVISSIWYHPYAAYHRWITVALILPALIIGVQWAFYFPEETHPRFRKALLYIQSLISALITLYFCKVSLNSPKKFHFTGHYWDFDAEDVSKLVAITIFTYLLIFIFSGFWRAYTLSGKERWAAFKITLGFAIATIIPVILNVLSRDGSFDRGTFMTTYVLFTVLGFFMVVLFYFDTTQDRTTFMAKIVGISLVTFLLLMQGLSFFTMQDRETEYDKLHNEYKDRALEGGKKHEDIQYIISISEDSENLQTEYNLSSQEIDLDYPLIKIDLLNTIIYEKLLALPEENFDKEARKILSNTHPEFKPYREILIDFLDTTPFQDLELKKQFLQQIKNLNTRTFVHTNKISNLPIDKFCPKVIDYIKKMKLADAPIREELLSHLDPIDCKWDGKELATPELRREIFKRLRYFKPAGNRTYRKTVDGYGHYITYSGYFPKEKTIKEIGFTYKEYRQYMHESAKEEVLLLFIVLGVLLIIFPYFFQGSLINPLSSLLRGVARVNRGDLEVVVPIKVQDEIGFLSGSFNRMVESIRQARKELEDYAQNLEEKVKERTKEVQEKMEEVQALKIQQDGDYFLTSLLAKPLFFNANKSQKVPTNFLIKQKKKFQFRNKEADLGGDICVTGNLRLGKPDNFKRYIMAMNGDAMGKSMQGAGGSLVMGVVMNSIMARSASNNRILDVTPEQWLTNVYQEIHAIFKSFNGTMVISATVVLVDEETGEMYFWNAEHPFTVLYRDGKASFLEEGLKLRKLGLESEYEFEVQQFQLHPGDIVILGSDGRDDIDLTPEEPVRTINEDETLFLRIVEEARGDIKEIERILQTKGAITDDLSLLRLDYFPQYLELQAPTEILESPQKTPSGKIHEINRIYQDSKRLYLSGDIYAAKVRMEEAYKLDPNIPKLNKLYGLLCFKTKDYEKAIRVIYDFLQAEPSEEEMWYYLSISYKKLGYYADAIQAGEKALDLNPSNLNNLINLADLHRIAGDPSRAKDLGEVVLAQDAENASAKKILAALQT